MPGILHKQWTNRRTCPTLCYWIIDNAICSKKKLNLATARTLGYATADSSQTTLWLDDFGASAWAIWYAIWLALRSRPESNLLYGGYLRGVCKILQQLFWKFGLDFRRHKHIPMPIHTVLNNLVKSWIMHTEDILFNCQAGRIFIQQKKNAFVARFFPRFPNPTTHWYVYNSWDWTFQRAHLDAYFSHICVCENMHIRRTTECTIFCCYPGSRIHTF